MCGIVGYIGTQDATPIILNGLRRLEYRGYDSAGLAVIEDGGIEVRRDAGKLDALDALVAAFTAWVAATSPEGVTVVGPSEEGQIVLPSADLQSRYS